MLATNLLKFDVVNRSSGKVQFTAEIDCAPNATNRVKLGLAVKWAIKSCEDLRGADLSGANLGGADLRGADLRGADLGGAYLGGANLGRAYLGGADLRGADLRGAYLSRAYLGGADLSGAYLGGAYLGGADLRGADLGGAYLSGANLRGADLRGADLRGQWIIQGGTRSDGHVFFLQKLTADTEPKVKAGCRYFTLREAQSHWETTRAGTTLLAETRALIRSMVDCAHARGLMVDGKAVVS